MSDHGRPLAHSHHPLPFKTSTSASTRPSNASPHHAGWKTKIPLLVSFDAHALRCTSLLSIIRTTRKIRFDTTYQIQNHTLLLLVYVGIPCDMENMARTQRYLDHLLSLPAELVDRSLGGWSVALIDPAQVIFKRYAPTLPQHVLIDQESAVPATHATSPSTTIRNAMSQHSKILTTALICYATSAIAFAFFHVISSPQTPNGGLRFFVKSKYVLRVFATVSVLTLRRKHPFYLNGRVVFLFFSQIVHGVLFLLRNVLLGRSIMGWRPSNSVSPTVSPLARFS